MKLRHSPLPPGTLLQGGRYEIIKPIGEGGMGAVYLGRAHHLACDVAIKETIEPTEFLRRVLEKEAKRLANLNHPALPKVSDRFSEDVLAADSELRSSHFLVMQYFSGETLHKLLVDRGSPFELEQVLAWADQLLEVLIYLHDKQPSPIIHRDIKPSNLKLTSDKKIVLLDFGLSKSMEEGTSFPGWASQPYSPLEQVQEAQTDVRSDIYALAATLYHLLTNAQPPTAGYRNEVVRQGARDPLKPPYVYNARVPRYVSDEILRAMSIEREPRHRDAGELRDLLRRAAQESEPPAPNGTTILMEPDEATLRDSEARGARGERESETSRTRTPMQMLTLGGVVQCVAFSPKGTALAGGSGSGELVLWDLRNGTTRLLGSDASAVNTIAFSPDGNTLACGRRNRVYLWDVESKSNWPLDTACNDVRAVTFSPDGSKLVTGGAKTAPTIIQIWDTNTFQIIDELRADKHFLTRWLCFSPDGRTLACALWSGGSSRSSDKSGQIYLLKLETGEVRLRADNMRVSAIAFSPDGNTLACGCRDSAIRLIDVHTGEIIRTLPGHRNAISSVIFSPDGYMLATADADEQARKPGEVRLWDWRAAKVRKRYERHAYGVRAVAFSPDGKYLAYASDRQVRIVPAAD